MAKKREPSKHSRAARRATSPSIDTDKSLKDIKPPPRSSASARPSVLAVQQSAGIHKKAKRGRKSQMSSKARRRHEKGIEMAEAVLERTGKKVQRSIGQQRVIKDRSKAWDTINKAAEEEGAEEDDDDASDAPGGKEWETDEEMDAKTEDAPAGEDVVEDAASKPAAAAAIIDEDEIL